MQNRPVKGVAKTFDIPLIEAGAQDYVAGVTIATGDCRVMKDGGAWADTTNDFVDEGEGYYSIALTATEMDADRVSVKWVDQTGTKEWEDQSLVIDTLVQETSSDALINFIKGRKVLSKTGLVWSLTVYDHTDDVTPILVKAIKDYLGNDIDDLVAKQLAMELNSSV